MPAIGGRQKLSLSIRDATGEIGTTALYFGEITAVSLPGLLTELGAYRTAVEGVTIGTVAREAWGEETVISNATPSEASAQRECKLLVQYQGVTTEKPYTLTIPTVDFEVLNFVPGGGDAIIFQGAGASSEILAWVTAFQSLARTPDDEAELVTVTGMRYVGRNT